MQGGLFDQTKHLFSINTLSEGQWCVLLCLHITAGNQIQDIRNIQALLIAVTIHRCVTSEWVMGPPQLETAYIGLLWDKAITVKAGRLKIAAAKKRWGKAKPAVVSSVI